MNGKRPDGPIILLTRNSGSFVGSIFGKKYDWGSGKLNREILQLGKKHRSKSDTSYDVGDGQSVGTIPPIESEDIGVKLVDASDSQIASFVPSYKLRCFNFIMESLGRGNMMLLSRGRYEDMLHQIEHTYNSSVSSSRPVLIRNSNVILPVKERLKGGYAFPRLFEGLLYCVHHSGVTDSNPRSMTPST
ncbi:hypothetical protein PROFUN_12498 [Planoprotostelium fungivorum]|uniref:Uncharacterized protein n=1 Tax=Planoprotostelium fungivorum TaxID=1890364 RepID=A0A2P6N791_9EUKA|nr:hypothetical protein PROFUN_12498 [Planoprotostelium fungivorum]